MMKIRDLLPQHTDSNLFASHELKDVQPNIHHQWERPEVKFTSIHPCLRGFALLEPKGMKQQLRLFLQCDPHGGPIY